MLADVINALVLGSIYSLFALGMSLVWGTTGVLNFAHGGIFLFAAFADYLLLNSVRLPLVPLLLIGMVVGALLAVLIQLLAFGPIMRRNRRKEAAELQILICGIGLAGILTGLVQIKTLGNPFGFSNSSYKISTFSVAGQHIAGIDVIVIVLGIALSAVVGLWVRRSKNGLALRAMGVDTETASLMGIDGTRLGLSAMAISGALAGLAGTLLTFTFSTIDSDTGSTLLLKAFAAIILGGVGSVGGTLLGCYFLGICETVVLVQTNGAWVDAISFGLLFILLLVRPQGFFGHREIRRT